jgi:hypothetical protein
VGSQLELPEHLRPVGGNYRKVTPGIDFPCWFTDSIKLIDENLHFVWHESSVLYDTPMSDYTGKADDPRFSIDYSDGNLHFGYRPRQPNGAPVPERVWHLWWLRPLMGWCHVMPIAALSNPYMKLLLERLYCQVRCLDSESARVYVKKLYDAEKQAAVNAHLQEQDEFRQITKANKRLVRSAMENMERGIIDATNPQKDVIRSYAGQGHRSTLRVPVTEREGGLITG